MKSSFLTTNKLISNINTYFGQAAANKTKYIYLYFD